MDKLSAQYSEILTRIDAVRRAENRQALLYGVISATIAATLLLLTVIILEQLTLPGTTTRTILFLGTALSIASLYGWLAVPALLRILGLRTSSDTSVLALRIGDRFPAIRDRLLDALQVYGDKSKLQSHYSIDLIDAAFADLASAIRPLDFIEAVDTSRVRTMRKYLLYTVGVALLTLVISPSGFFGSLYRIVHYGETFAAPLPISFSVEPGSIDAIRGQNVSIVVRAEGKPVQEITLQTRLQGQVGFDQQILHRNPDGTFRTELSSIKLSTEYFARAEDIESDRFTIRVLDRPLVRELNITITPPAYTGLPPRTLDENTGDISAYPGSIASLRIVSSKDLVTAAIVFHDSISLSLKSDGVSAGGSFRVRTGTSYHILLHDRDSLPNLDPVEYTVKVIPDEYPTAEIVSPAKNVDLTADMNLPLLIRIKDDFGFSRLRLAYRLSQSKYEQPRSEYTFIDLPLRQPRQTSIDVTHLWALSELHLVPEDAIEYYAEVFDNDNVSGPKSGRSETFTARVPSLEEVFSDVDQSHQQSLESMQSVAKETQQLRKDIEDVQQEMKKNRDKMDWQQQKKAEDMLQRYDAMKKNLEQTAQKMDEMVKKMEENKVLSEETLQKYAELQKLMDQLNSPELKDALKKLQDMMKRQQVSPEQMKQAMEQLKATEEQFRKSLERTVELLKRIHIEQKVDELIKRADDLAKQQDALKQEAQKTASSDQQKRDELAKKQEDLQKQADALEKEAAGLKDKMEEFPKDMPVGKMSEAQKNLQQKQVPQKMQKSARDMKSGDMKQAEQQQEQAEQDLAEFKQQMEDIQKQMQNEQMKQVVNALKKQLENLVELSKREEGMKDETRNLDVNSQRFRENAQQQNDAMSDLTNVANALTEIAKKSFSVNPEMGKEIGDAMHHMSEAMRGMEGRNPGDASANQEQAMGALNRAAMAVQGALAGMMQGAGKSGMGMAGLMGMLGQMAGNQGTLNSATQQAMGMGQGGQGMSAQQQAEYGRLAGQQGALQKSLEDLSREAKNAGEFSKLLGDLDRIAEEMKEVQTDLEQNNVNPETIRKQERIFSRLLDSQRSMRERDYEKKRTAEQGKPVNHQSPGDIDLTTQEGRNRLRDELLKVREGRYSKDYEELIKNYFEQLEKEQEPK